MIAKHNYTTKQRPKVKLPPQHTHNKTQDNLYIRTDLNQGHQVKYWKNETLHLQLSMLVERYSW